ncbi:MAG TPA: hypothetical protein VNA25_02220 [Phycisphaerae bacterium]|nr:hypothetical protein [Phycisphaerae bacterium]
MDRPARTRALAAVLLALAGPVCGADDPRLKLMHRWVYVSTNMLVNKNVENTLSLLERVAKAGYNGIVLTDSKFMRWDSLPGRYAANVGRVRNACRKLKLDVIAAVCPIGYSEGLLAHDANLAAGLPVKGAPFIVRGGRLVPDDPIKLANGGFEDHRGHKPAGWGWADKPGEISFIDTDVRRSGRASLRMQDIGRLNAPHGNGRVMQKLKVEPFRYYHVSAWVRTKDFDAADQVRIAVLADGRTLNYYEPRIARTQDWRRVDITFNSLEHREVNLYLGVWGGKGGAIWWDDARIEPAGLVNAVRRAGAPLKLTSADGRTTYTEGKDFAGASDPKLGNVPWPGGFTIWHDPPAVAVPAGSRLVEGQRVRMSYYHTAIIHRSQVACCMSEPKVYDILDWQIARVLKNVSPDGWFMQHDEIRVQGWDESCAATKLTPGGILADNVRRCTSIIRKHDAAKPIYVWSDMFDPHHNAGRTGRTYYLVKGVDPWYGSWEGLDPNVVIVNWHNHAAGRLDSLKHFASRGHRQILAGYYDAPPGRIVEWLREAQQVKGVIGVMYTTWKRDYSKLDAFAHAAASVAQWPDR